MLKLCCWGNYIIITIYISGTYNNVRGEEEKKQNYTHTLPLNNLLLYSTSKYFLS